MDRTAHPATESDAAVTSPTARQRLTLRDRFLAWRDRLIMNPGFQSWAADFFFTRRVARRSAEQLFDVCAGFVYSQILLACVRLNVFEILREGPQSLVDIARRLGLPTDQTRRLLTSAVSLDLVQRRSAGRFGLGPLGAAMLGNPAVANMVRHHPMFYDDMSDPVALLRGDPEQMSLSRFWLYSSVEEPADTTSNEVSEYTSLMGETQAMIATDVLDAYDLSSHRKLLDIGGGNGAFLAAAAAKSPNLELTLFDLPAVAAQAETNLDRLGLGDRATTFGGDAFADSLPRGADLVSLVRVLYDHDDPAVLGLLRNARAAMNAGDTLLIAEPFATEQHRRRITDAYFEFYLLAMGSGRPRTPREITGLLKEAGFRRVRFPRTRRPMLTGLAVAEA